ncbi:MAG: proline--tRNA ligase [Planctomycetota bacterium]|nr:proline--tRNA ligase [Planctomycetota bacterium]
MGVRITPRSKSFPDWYQDVCQAGDLAENSPVRGCMVIKPHGFALWENIRDPLDRMIKETGHVNAYFPIFIPLSFLSKEAEHVEGFAAETALVTHYRLKAVKEDGKTKMIVDPDSELEEPLVVRPTSETIIGHMYAKWIQSHRDLPVLINQWANIVRWEMRTRLFLRTTEFLWQEGHTCHATADEAQAETMQMLGVYERLCREYLAVPVRVGLKSPLETFPGADATYAVEGLMQDGKALQMGTSHNLGQNFAKAFEIQFQDTDGERKLVWTTSWGLSTRTVGAVVMAHGDDDGLVLPPRIAPLQVVIVPIFRKEEERAAVLAEAGPLFEQLNEAGVRVRLDDRTQMKPGAKFFEWEKKGVPVRLELGPRDVESRQAMLVRRDDKSKTPEPLEGLAAKMPALLVEIQDAMLTRATRFRDEHTHEANSWEEFQELLDDPGGFISAHWDGTRETEAEIKAKTKATIRVIPTSEEAQPGACVLTGKPSERRVLFGRAY